MPKARVAPSLLTAEQVAERLSLSVKHVRRLMQSGELQVTRMGRRAVRVAEDDLLRFVETHRLRAQ